MKPNVNLKMAVRIAYRKLISIFLLASAWARNLSGNLPKRERKKVEGSQACGALILFPFLREEAPNIIDVP